MKSEYISNQISKNINYFIVCIHIISLCLFWDTNLTKLGFILSTVATVLIIFEDLRRGGKGTSEVITSIYFWWILFIVGMIGVTMDNVPAYYIQTQIIKIILMIETVIIFGIGMFSVNRWNRKKFGNMCIFCSIVLCLWILINEINEIINLNLNVRIGWSAGGANPNFVGIVLGIFSVVTLNEFITNKKLKYIFILIMQYSFMLMTGSKKVLIYIFIPIILYAFLKNNKYKLVYIIFAILVIIGMYQLIMNVEILYEIVGVRIDRFLMALGLKGYQADNSTTHRLLFIKQAFEFWKTRPLLGYGYQGFAYILGFGTYTHMNYIEMLVSFGIIGFLVFYGMYIYILTKLIKYRKKITDSELFIVLLTMQLIVDVGVVSYYDILLFYIALIGGFYLVQKMHKEEKKVCIKNTK